MLIVKIKMNCEKEMLHELEENICFDKGSRKKAKT